MNKSQFTNKQKKQIRNRYKNGETQKQIADDLGVSQGTIHRILHYNHTGDYNKELAKREGITYKQKQFGYMKRKGKDINSYSDYFNKIAKKNGHKNNAWRQKHYIKRMGYGSQTEYYNILAKKKGHPSPYSRLKSYRRKKEDLSVWNSYKKNQKKKGREGQCEFRVRFQNNLKSALKHYTKNGKIRKTMEYGIDYKKIIRNLKPTKKRLEKYNVDHIIPLNSYDLTDKNEVKKVYDYKNLRWLEKSKNSKKKDKINYKLIQKVPVRFWPKKYKQSKKFWTIMKK